MINFPFLPRKLSKLCQSSLLILATSLGLSLKPSKVLAAEEIVITFSFLDQPILVKDLETFVETGEMSPAIRFLVGISQQDPDDVREVLTKEVSIDSRLVYKVSNSLPGEYLLFQAGQVVHPRYKPNRALIPALRGTLILSTTDDQKISLLEFFQKYPTKEMYIDGRLLAKTAINTINFINDVEETLEVPLAIAKDFLAEMVCDCEITTTSTNPSVIKIEANSSQK